jgi:hypothetical protein
MAQTGSRVVAGHTEVAEAGKPVKLLTGETLETVCLEILISADPSNVGAFIAVGDKNVLAEKTLGKPKGIILEKKQVPLSLTVGDPGALYVDVEKGKDFVTWLAVLA